MGNIWTENLLKFGHVVLELSERIDIHVQTRASQYFVPLTRRSKNKLECGPVPNAMVALPNIGGALCSTPQNVADAHYQNAVQ